MKYDQLDSNTLYAQGATNCTDDHADRLTEIADLATDLYRQAFDREVKDSSELLDRF